MDIFDTFLTISFKLLLSFSQHVFYRSKVCSSYVVLSKLFTYKCIKTRSSFLMDVIHLLNFYIILPLAFPLLL
jgi:hypothetical protein